MDRISQKIVLDVLLFMGEHGIRYRESELKNVFDYADRMMMDKRIAIVKHKDGIHTVLFFSICSGYKNYLRKPTWIYKEHDSTGKIVYIEKIVSKSYNKEIRLKIQQLIMSLYPSVTIGKWHRWGRIGDREITTTPKEICNVTV